MSHSPAKSPPTTTELAAFCAQGQAKNGTPLTVRAICPADEALMIPFHNALSERTVRYRYFGDLKLGQRVLHERLLKVCHCDFLRDIALVALAPPLAPATTPASGDQIIGVGRIGRDDPTSPSMEFALLVRDDWQGQGVGKLLLSTLISIARQIGLSRLTADILPENREMTHLAQNLGFTLTRDEEENLVRAKLDL